MSTAQRDELETAARARVEVVQQETEAKLVLLEDAKNAEVAALTAALAANAPPPPRTSSSPLEDDVRGEADEIGGGGETTAARIADWLARELDVSRDDALTLGAHLADHAGATKGEDLLDADLFDDLDGLEAFGLKAVPRKKLAKKRHGDGREREIKAWLEAEVGARPDDALRLARHLCDAGATHGEDLLDSDLFDDLEALEAFGLRPVPRKKLAKRRRARLDAAPPPPPPKKLQSLDSDDDDDDDEPATFSTLPPPSRPARVVTYDEAVGPPQAAARETARLRAELEAASEHLERAASARARASSERDAVLELQRACPQAPFAADLHIAKETCDRTAAEAARLEEARREIERLVKDREAREREANAKGGWEASDHWRAALEGPELRRNVSIDLELSPEGFDASLSAADVDADDTGPVRTFDLSNANHPLAEDDDDDDDDGQGDDSYGILGICLDMPAFGRARATP